MDFGENPLLGSTVAGLCCCALVSSIAVIITLLRKGANSRYGLLCENARLQKVIQEMVDAQTARYFAATPTDSNAGRSQPGLATPTVSVTREEEVTQNDTGRTRSSRRRTTREREDVPPESRHLALAPHSLARFYAVKSPGVEAIYRSWGDCDRAKSGGGVGSYKGYNNVNLALGFLDWVRPMQQR